MSSLHNAPRHALDGIDPQFCHRREIRLVYHLLCSQPRHIPGLTDQNTLLPSSHLLACDPNQQLEPAGCKRDEANGPAGGSGHHEDLLDVTQKLAPVDGLLKSVVWFDVSHAWFPRTLLIMVLDIGSLYRQARLLVVFVGLTFTLSLLLTLTLVGFQCRACSTCYLAVYNIYKFSPGGRTTYLLASPRED